METNQKDPPKNGKKKNKSKNKAQKQLKANENTNNNERDDKPVETKEKEKEAPIAIMTNHNVIILGDSMVKNLQGWRTRTSMKSNEKIIVRSF